MIVKLSRLGVAAALLVVLVGPGAPADASPVMLGPWTSNHFLCTAQRCPQSNAVNGELIVNRGDLVGFWQTILNADGFASVCTSNGIDGVFGGRSESNTRSWQAAFDLPGHDALTVDGIVGPNTWTAAYQYMQFDGYDSGFTQYWHYGGAVRHINIYYYFQVLNWEKPSSLIGGSWYRDANHPNITFSPC